MFQQIRCFNPFVKHEGGAIAAIAAIGVFVLAGILVLAVDLSRLYAMNTELQNAVDHAALAAATQLDNNPGARDRAKTAAITSPNALVANSQTFASDGVGSGVIIEDANFRFLVDLVTRAEATTDEEANFVEITATPRTTRLSYAGVLGALTNASTTARAVAGMGSAFCQVPPLFVCQPDGGMPPAGTGVWMKGKDKGDNGAWKPGNFGILALNMPDGSTSLSANLIRDSMGRVNPLAECFSTSGEVQTKPGETTTIKDGLNMRLDIYDGVAKGLENNEQYHPSPNTIKGLHKMGSKCTLQDSQGWAIPPGQYKGPSTDPATVDAMTFPRDNCAYPTTEGGTGTCIAAGGEGRFGTGDWDMNTYMAVNHAAYGTSAAMDDGYDLNSDGKISRYEFYRWEIGMDHIVDLPPTGEQADTVNTPICYSGNFPPGYDDPDRRVITIAVLDCTGMAGTTTAVPLTFWDVFLTEPVGVYLDNKSIYAELIGEAAPGTQTTVARHVVQLYE